MKMLPVQLSLNPPLGLWSDVLWRCPPAPPSQLAELKTQLPPSLPSDPRLWGREDVTVFLRFCEREFDLPKVDYDLFQMNGKALCLLNRADFGHRCPGAGDVLHNVLQMLIIESHMMQWHLPNSPVTPTSRYPLSPHSHPPTPTWPPIAPPHESTAGGSSFHTAAHMHHFMAPPNSVTLSPPPSVDSQASSPPQGQEQNGGGGAANNSSSVSSSSSNGSSSATSGAGMSAGSAFAAHNNAGASNCSNQSDSDEESYAEAKHSAVAAAAAAAAAAAVAQYNTSPPTTPILKDMPQSLSQQITNSFVNSWSAQQSTSPAHVGKLQPGGNGNGGSVSAPTTPSYMQPVKREFFPENTEPNTNGRLLWDFLQQLLNDRNQKYSDLIAWKCRDTGVFKIVDPAGLAKLWGIQKNHLSMNYDKMSRALRYYYRVNILRKVQGERHCYQFLRNPTELKNIKNISLLRQSVASGTPANNSGVGSASNASQQQSGPQSSSSTNVSSSNWTLPHQHGLAAAAAAQQQQQQQQLQQQQQQQQQQHTPQRPSSRSSNSNHMTLPAAAAAVAAAAAAAYGPPPTSPLFMHAINGAFQYLSANSVPPPNSPAATLPPTPSEKFQFNGGTLKLESSSNHSQESMEEMKPTDLSVGGGASSSEKRPYSSPSAEDCYPLIRNADGLTTIKLIRYNDSSDCAKSPQPQAAEQQQQQQQSNGSPATQRSQEQQEPQTPMHMDSDGSNSNEMSTQYGGSLMPTDLRK